MREWKRALDKGELERVERYEAWAKGYRPEKGDLDVLFVAESPPEPEEDYLPYFYNTESDGKSRLSSQLKSALDMEAENREDFLKSFKGKGYFLIDLFPTYDYLQKVENAESSEEKGRLKAPLIKRFAAQVKECSPDRIVFIHKGAAKQFALPFPGNGNQTAFKEEFRPLREDQV